MLEQKKKQKKKKNKKPFKLRDDLIPLNGYVGSLVFYAKFSHVSKIFIYFLSHEKSPWKQTLL